MSNIVLVAFALMLLTTTGWAQGKYQQLVSVLAPWNCLNINSENLRSITSFKRLIKGSDLSVFLHYFL